MANCLKVAMSDSITMLAERGWPQRRIARELGVSREAVARCLGLRRAAATSPPAVLVNDQNQPKVPAGSGAPLACQNQPKVPAGFERSQSQCLAHAALIAPAVEQGLTAQRIWQDLVAGQQFTGSYDAVKRYVRRLRKMAPEPFRRLECAPGAEAQVDFGTGAWVVGDDGKRRRPHLFRLVLSHSRKAYSEVLWRQDTESVIRALENGFRAFNGVPRTLVPDNLKAAVLRPEWADPDLTPKLRDFCRHYGTVLLPTKVRTPRHKGKIERAVGYAQDNALKGRTFRTLAEQNAYLQQWERQVADTRIHGTTREQVQAAFAREQPQLLPLPETLFPCFEEGPRQVHRDGHVEVAHSYYSAPPEYVHRELWVRWDLRTVRLFNPRTFACVRVHARVAAGSFQTDWRDIPARKIAAIEHGEHHLLRQVAQLGDHAHAWAKAMLQARGLEGVRVLVGLLGLGRRHPATHLNAACQEARRRQQWRLRAVRALLHTPGTPPAALVLHQHHELIRDLAHYQTLVGSFQPLLTEETP